MPAAEKKQTPQKARPKKSGQPLEILTTELREIYSAENQLARALPKIVRATT